MKKKISVKPDDYESKILDDTRLVEFLKGEGKIIFDIPKKDWVTYERASEALEMPITFYDTPDSELVLRLQFFADERVQWSKKIEAKEKTISKIKKQLDSASSKHIALKSRLMSIHQKYLALSRKRPHFNKDRIDEKLQNLNKKMEALPLKIKEVNRKLSDFKVELQYRSGLEKIGSDTIKNRLLHDPISFGHPESTVNRNSSIQHLRFMISRFSKEQNKLESELESCELEKKRLLDDQRESRKLSEEINQIQLERTSLQNQIEKYNKIISSLNKKLKNERKVRLEIVKQKEEIDEQYKFTEGLVRKRGLAYTVNM